MKIDLKELKEKYDIKSIKQINIDGLPTLLIGETEAQVIHGFSFPYKQPCFTISEDYIHIHNTSASIYFSNLLDKKSYTVDNKLNLSISNINIVFPIPHIKITKNDICDIYTMEYLSNFL